MSDLDQKRQIDEPFNVLAALRPARKLYEPLLDALFTLGEVNNETRERHARERAAPPQKFRHLRCCGRPHPDLRS